MPGGAQDAAPEGTFWEAAFRPEAESVF